MYSNEQIFAWDMDALQQILANPVPRNLLDASAILRRLLTDSAGPLIHKVAKGRDFKPQFELNVSDIEGLDRIVGKPAHHWANPAPLWANSKTKQVGLDDFLREPVHRTTNEEITVKELINYVANVGGGVHQGTPRKRDNAEAIHALANTFILNDKPLPLESMQPIALIAFKALTPLYERLRA